MGMKLAVTLVVAVLAACRGGATPDTDQPQARAFGGLISPTSVPSTTLASLTTGAPGTENGQQLLWNGASWNAEPDGADPAKRYLQICEFEIGTTCVTLCGGYYVGAISGTGATCSYATNTAGHPGVLSMQTGTAVTSGDRFASTSALQLGNGEGTWCTRWLVAMNALSTSVTEYVFRAGFVEPSSNADSADAIEFVYDRPTTGDKWSLRTCNNSTCTTTIMDGTGGTTNQPITALAWYTLEACVNPAGTSATGSVNGVVSATNTTNIPTGSTRLTSTGAQCFNNNGSVPVNQICYVDYSRNNFPFGVAR